MRVEDKDREADWQHFNSHTNPRAVNDNFVQNYPGKAAYDVQKLLERNMKLRAMVGYLSLLDPDVLLGKLEDIRKVAAPKGKSSVLDGMDLTYVSYGGDVFVGSMRGKRNELSPTIVMEFASSLEVDDGEDISTMRGFPYRIEMSAPFAVSLIEDAGYLTQKSNRFTGAIGHLFSAVICHKHENSIDSLDGNAAQEIEVTVLLDHDQKRIEFFDIPPSPDGGFLLCIFSSDVLHFEPDNVEHDLDIYSESVSPEFLEIYNEISRRFGASFEPITRAEKLKSIVSHTGTISLEKPEEIGYMRAVVGSIVTAFMSGISAGLLDEKRKSVALTKERLLELDSNLKTNHDDGDVLSFEEQESIGIILRMGLNLLPNYHFESRGFVRSDDTEIVRTDAPNTFGTEQSGEDAGSEVIRRYKPTEETALLKLNVPISLKEAFVQEAKARKISYNAVANMYFDGDESVIGNINARWDANRKASAPKVKIH